LNPRLRVAIAKFAEAACQSDWAIGKEVGIGCPIEILSGTSEDAIYDV